jgi:hypothetical protein
MPRAAVFVLIAGLLCGLVAAQPPGDKKTPPTAAKKEPPKELPKTDGVTADEKSFTSADGVKLRGLFYKSTKGGNGPVVILLHEYKKDPNDSRWDSTAKLLAAGGFNAFRFAFRGHGDLRSLHSKDIVPEEFFRNPTNRNQVRAANPATKNLLDPKDLPNSYLPMLVQDIAAARNLLDQMNDAGECNTSSVYLLGAGDTVNLGLLFIASEFHREREMPRGFFGGVVPPVTAVRGLLGDVGSAGPDYAGAVWVGPATNPSQFPTATVKQWVEVSSGLKIRNEVPMLFLYGGQDAKGKQAAETFYNTVLRAEVRTGGLDKAGRGQTHKYEVKGTKLTGSGLLGANLETERVILDYLTEVEKERKNKPRKARDLTKPAYIEVTTFGVLR